MQMYKQSRFTYLSSITTIYSGRNRREGQALPPFETSVSLHKKQVKIFCKNTKFLLTQSGILGILIERVCWRTGVLCDEAGDCSVSR